MTLTVKKELLQSVTISRRHLDDPSDDDSPSDKKSIFAAKVLRKLYLNEQTADVYFACGPKGNRIPAHKCLLSRASDAFDRMLYGPLAESNDIKMPGISADSFKDFLQFCYLDEVSLKLETITDVIGLAHKYQMTECFSVCGKFWANHLTTDDLCWAYHWAIHYDIDELRAACEHKICVNPKSVFQTYGFLTCGVEVLHRILDLDYLLCAESTIIEACLMWAKQNNGDLRSLYKIRFASMTQKEFSRYNERFKEFFSNPEEFEDISKIVSGLKDLKTRRFNILPRPIKMFKWNEDNALECQLEYSNSHWVHLPTKSNCVTNTLTSNRVLLLGGFYCTNEISSIDFFTPFDFDGLYAPPTTPVSVQVRIVEHFDGNSIVKLQTERVTLHKGEEMYFGVENKPILIQADHEYCIEFDFATNELRYHPLLFDGGDIELDDETHIQLHGDHILITCFNFNVL